MSFVHVSHHRCVWIDLHVLSSNGFLSSQGAVIILSDFKFAPFGLSFAFDGFFIDLSSSIAFSGLFGHLFCHLLFSSPPLTSYKPSCRSFLVYLSDFAHGVTCAPLCILRIQYSCNPVFPYALISCILCHLVFADVMYSSISVFSEYCIHIFLDAFRIQEYNILVFREYQISCIQRISYASNTVFLYSLKLGILRILYSRIRRIQDCE